MRRICFTAINNHGNIIYSDRTKSESSRRVLPMTPMVETRLKAEKRRQSENKLKFGSSYKNSGFVCCWSDGTPIYPEYITRRWNKVVKASGVPYIQFRNLRDTSATLLHDSGFDAKSIQGWLGHSDVSTTANIYVHFKSAEMEAMAESMGEMLSMA